jgi:hypothetical protein
LRLTAGVCNHNSRLIQVFQILHLLSPSNARVHSAPATGVSFCVKRDAVPHSPTASKPLICRSRYPQTAVTHNRTSKYRQLRGPRAPHRFSTEHNIPGRQPGRLTRLILLQNEYLRSNIWVMLGLSSLKCKKSKNFFKPQKVALPVKTV